MEEENGGIKARGEERMYKTEVEMEGAVGKAFTCFIKEGKCKFVQAKVIRTKPGYCVCCQYTENENFYECPYVGEEIRVDGGFRGRAINELLYLSNIGNLLRRKNRGNNESEIYFL